MKIAHTPAPWSIVPIEDIPGAYTLEGFADNMLEAYESNNPQSVIAMNQQDRANAQLIATAPELLEALKLAEKILLIMKTRYAEYLRGRSYWDEGLDLDLDSAIPKAEIAIAKATINKESR